MRKKKIEFGKRLLMFTAGVIGLVLLMAFMVSPEAGLTVSGVMAIVPIFGLVSDGTFKTLSADEVAKLDPEDQIKYFNQLNIHKEKQMEDLQAKLKKESSEEIKSQIDLLKAEIMKDNKEQLTLLKNAIKAQGETMTKLLANGGSPTQAKTLVDQIKAVSEGIKSAVEKRVKEFEFEVKADTMRASVASSTDALRLTEIGQLSNRRLSARDVFSVVPVGAGSNGVIRYADWDVATTVRAAAMVAEGAQFPESTAKWEEFTLQIKKVGDSIAVTEDMVMDAGRFAKELDMFIHTNIAIIEDTQLITGDGTGTNLNGIYPTAPTYTAVASGISDASIYDLIVTMRSAITGTHGSKYDPDFAFMNTGDINKMKLKKDANENYIIPPFVDRNGSQVDGIMIIENNAIVADTLVLGDSRYAKIYQIEGISVGTGYVGDQYTGDLMTMKARQRENLLIRNVDKTGFLKCTGIAAALVTLAS